MVGAGGQPLHIDAPDQLTDGSEHSTPADILNWLATRIELTQGAADVVSMLHAVADHPAALPDHPDHPAVQEALNMTLPMTIGVGALLEAWAASCRVDHVVHTLRVAALTYQPDQETPS